MQKDKNMRTTSVALGNYFENFVRNKISQGRYNNASEVIRAGLRSLERDELKILEFKKAIEEGIQSGIVEDFDPVQNLLNLKKSRVQHE